MLPDNVTRLLINNLHWCFEESYSKHQNKFIVDDDSKEYFYHTLNLRAKDSSFIDFYSIVAFVPMGIGSELFGLELILEENIPGARYLKFTSAEGEGSYYYDVDTDAVYDISWGEEKLMELGEKKPWFTTFYEFLAWYYSEEK